MTSPSDIDRFMKATQEDEHLEFKEAKTQYDNTKLFRYCVALANEGGGKLLLGVTDKRPRYVVGSKACYDPTGMSSKLFHKLGFRVDVEAVDHPRGRVVVFHIPSRPRGTAYELEGAYLMRSADEVVAMSEDRLRRIFSEGKADWEELVAVENCSPEDVIRLLDTQAYFELFHLPYPANRAGVLDRLEKDNVITHSGEGWSITNLGAALFAKRLDEIDSLTNKTPRVIVYEGQGKLETRLEQVGARGYAVGFEGLIEFINAQIPTNEVIRKALREEKKMFPKIAVRELVANALIHQDFSEPGSCVMVELFADRLEVSSPGVPAIKPERFIDEYQSRNERLASVMRRVGVCEEKGSGIDKVINAAEVFQLPAPDFRVGERRMTAVMYAHKNFENMDREDRLRACYQHCCLRYVMNQKMTNQTLRERFGLHSSKTAITSQVISAAAEAGLIRQEEGSSKRYAHYRPFWA